MHATFESGNTCHLHGMDGSYIERRQTECVAGTLRSRFNGLVASRFLSTSWNVTLMKIHQNRERTICQQSYDAFAKGKLIEGWHESIEQATQVLGLCHQQQCRLQVSSADKCMFAKTHVFDQKDQQSECPHVPTLHFHPFALTYLNSITCHFRQ